jgi:hypothetical protein
MAARAMTNFSGAAHARPSAISKPRVYGEPSGVQLITSATAATVSQSARSALVRATSCSGPIAAASRASAIAARSRDRRERRAVAKALVTDRLTATQRSRPHPMPTSWARAAKPPPS